MLETISRFDLTRRVIPQLMLFRHRLLVLRLATTTPLQSLRLMPKLNWVLFVLYGLPETHWLSRRPIETLRRTWFQSQSLVPWAQLQMSNRLQVVVTLLWFQVA
jgi:hypothetical protein